MIQLVITNSLSVFFLLEIFGWQTSLGWRPLIVSICSHCGQAGETARHLLIECLFGMFFWSWLSSILGCNLLLLEPLALLESCSKAVSSLLQEIFLAAVINTAWLLWLSRNNARFQNGYFSHARIISDTIGAVSLSGNLSKGLWKTQFPTSLFSGHFISLWPSFQGTPYPPSLLASSLGKLVLM